MGIAGLLQLLAPVMQSVHVSMLDGKRVAIDSYSWLHKGAYACAQQLVLGNPTDVYVWARRRPFVSNHKNTAL